MKLSVIMVSYNSLGVMEKSIPLALKRLAEIYESNDFELIVVDNGSEKETVNFLKKTKNIKTIFLNENIGFGRANNVGLEVAGGEYVLFLNTDVYLKEKVDFKELIEFLEHGENRGALTIKLKLPNGQLDWASHRGFPTPWRAFCYFSKLEHISKSTFLNRLFGGYHLTHESLEATHKIDSGTAAFLLVKRTVLKHMGGFDPDYFFYGEDLDLCYRINMLGYSVWYYPKYSAVHLKYQSSKKSENHQTKSKTRKMFYQTMLTFYNKHYQKRYPKILGSVVSLGVKLLAWKDKDAR